MSIDLTLVSGAQPVLDDFAEALAPLDEDHALEGALEVDPADAEAGLAVGILTLTDGEERPVLAVYTPRRAGGGTVADLSTRLGVRAPLDDDGRCWITQMAMSADSTDEEIRAVLALLAPVAARRSGYLVVNGEPVGLDGVPSPAPAAAATATEPALPPAFNVFLTARLDLGVTTGTDGWHTVVRHLGRLLAAERMRDTFTPDLILDRDRAWQHFDQHGSAPAWWPAKQRLARHRPRTVWELYGAGFPADRFSGITGKFAADAQVGPMLLDRLVALAPHHLQYAMVHAWTPDEPTGDTGFLPISRSSHDPRLGIGDRETGLARHLPNLYWGQVFGPPWVHMFGVEVLRTTPAHRVEELPGGCWLVQLTPLLTDLGTDYPAYADVRERCKDHLGAECFWSPARDTYRTPVLPDLEERGLVERLRAGEA